MMTCGGIGPMGFGISITGGIAGCSSRPSAGSAANGCERMASPTGTEPTPAKAKASTGVAEFRAMYEDNYLYIAVRELNANWQPKPRLSTRNDDEYFGDTPVMRHTNRTRRWAENPPAFAAAAPYQGNCLRCCPGGRSRRPTASTGAWADRSNRYAIGSPCVINGRTGCCHESSRLK